MLPVVALGAALAAVGIMWKSRMTEPPSTLRDPSIARDAVVRAAAGEVGSSDRARYVVPELGRDEPVSWCRIFALWVLRQAGLAEGIRWVLGRGFEERHLTAQDPRTFTPQPGDIAYWTRNQHGAIVESYDPTTDRIVVINGNGFGGYVTRTIHRRQEPTRYYSIEKLIA